MLLALGLACLLSFPERYVATWITYEKSGRPSLTGIGRGVTVKVGADDHLPVILPITYSSIFKSLCAKDLKNPLPAFTISLSVRKGHDCIMFLLNFPV